MNRVSNSRMGNQRDVMNAIAMLGGVNSQVAAVPVVEKKEVERGNVKKVLKKVEKDSEESISGEDEITIKSIIRDKPSTNEVREFYKTNLKNIFDGEDF